MATNPVLGNTFFDIVKEAYLILGVVDRERSLTADLRSDGFSMLNKVIKNFQVIYHLWTDTEAVVLLQSNQVQYSLGPNGDHITDANDLRNYNTDSSSSGTTLNVTGNILANDNIGVFLNDGSIFWTTVVSYVAGAATLTDALPSTVSAGNLVYVYTNKIPRPMKIVNCRYSASLSGSDTPTTKYNRTQYFETLDKTETGSIQAWYYSPQLSDGNFYVYKAPASDANVVRMTYTRPLEVSEENGDQLDFPSEWYLPLSYYLAMALAPQFATPADLMADINQKASYYGEGVGLPPLGKLQPIPEAGRA